MTDIKKTVKDIRDRAEQVFETEISRSEYIHSGLVELASRLADEVIMTGSDGSAEDIDLLTTMLAMNFTGKVFAAMRRTHTNRVMMNTLNAATKIGFKSSMIYNAVWYQGDVLVTFRDDTDNTKPGATYIYYKVPINIFESMLHAESIGKFFIANIKSTYKYQRLTPP